MEWSIQELKDTREAVGKLLDELGLAAYVFGVEPQNGTWQIRLECPEEKGWRTVELHVQKQDLGDCDRDSDVRQKVLASWQAQLLTGRAD